VLRLRRLFEACTEIRICNPDGSEADDRQRGGQDHHGYHYDDSYATIGQSPVTMTTGLGNDGARLYARPRGQRCMIN
jgi:hypothetical protein